MATLSQAAGPKARSLPELEAAGVCRRDLPVGRAVRGGAMRCATCCACSSASNSLAPCQEHLIPLDDYYELVGLKALLAREESYDKAAAALVQQARGGIGEAASNGARTNRS